MNFKEESISINETISKLLESSDQDINVNIKQVEEVKEEKVEPKRMNLKELIKQIEEEKRKKDEEAREYYEKLRKDSFTQITINNSSVIPPPSPPSLSDVRKSSIIQVSNNDNNYIEEENKKECEKEYEKVPIFKNQDIKENKSGKKEEKINKDTKKETITTKAILNENKKKPKMTVQKTMTHKKVESLIVQSNKVHPPLTKYNTMKSKTPIKQRVKTPISQKKKEIEPKPVVIIVPPLKIKPTHIKTISTDISKSRVNHTTRNSPSKQKQVKEMYTITEHSMPKNISRNINELYSTRRDKTKRAINTKMILSKITKDFFERQLSFEKKKKAKREKMAEELKRKEEEELTKNIKQIKLTKEGFKNKLYEFKEWEEKKKQRINQLKKEQEKKNKKEVQQSSNKNYTKEEINDTINRLYKEDLNKKKYIIHQTGAIFNSNKKRKNRTEHNTKRTSLSHDKGYKPYLTSASKNE